MHSPHSNLASRLVNVDLSPSLDVPCLLSAQVKVSVDAKATWDSSKFNSTITASTITDASLAIPKWKGVGKHFTLYQDAWNGNNLTATGLPDPREIQGFNHYNLAFWLSTTGAVDALQHFQDASEADRTAALKACHDAGITVSLTAFGSTDTPQSNNLTAQDAADKLAKFVIDYNLDGVEVDYLEYELFSAGKSVAYLIDMIKALRKQLPSPQYLLSTAPLAPWANPELYPKDGGYAEINKQVGHLIDYYNFQFYSQNDYVTKESLLYKSGTTYPGTSLWQIILNHGFEPSKVIVGKPVTQADATNGWVSPKHLGDWLREAVFFGWNGGLAFWQYKANYTNDYFDEIRERSGL